MERLLQINIIGIHRRVLSPTKRPARRGFYIFSTLHLLLLPPPTLLPIFFVSPPPPLPLAASHQRRTSIAPSPPPPPPRRRCHHDRGTHTRGARELSFLLFAFFGIFPVAPSIVSRFVIVIRLHPAKRERGEGSRTGIHRTLQRQTPILLPYPPPLPPALPPPPPPTLQPSPISHPDPHPPPPSPLYPCCTLFHSLPLHLPLFRHRPRPSSLHFPFPLPSSSSQLSYRSAYPYGVPSAVQPLCHGYGCSGVAAVLRDRAVAMTMMTTVANTERERGSGAMTRNATTEHEHTMTRLWMSWRRTMTGVRGCQSLAS